MKVFVLLGLLACMSFGAVRGDISEFLHELQSDISLENRNLVDSTINKTVEKYRKQFAEYDPYDLAEYTKKVGKFLNVTVDELELSGFSNFAFTSLSASLIKNHLKGTIYFPDVVLSLATLHADSGVVCFDVNVNKSGGEIKGLSLDIDTKFDLKAKQLKSLSLLIQFEEIDISLHGNINDYVIDLTADSGLITEFVNSVLKNNQEELSALILEVVNNVAKIVTSA